MKRIISIGAFAMLCNFAIAQNTPQSVQIRKLTLGKTFSTPVKPGMFTTVNSDVETVNGITYKVFYANSRLTPIKDKDKPKTYKGILVIGSGNNENAPYPGSLDGSQETSLCQKAAANGYIAAIVQYKVIGGLDKWSQNADKMAQDYNNCITALATKYGIDKNKSVVAGISYSSFMLLSAIAQNNTLSYCKGLLAPCGATSSWSAQNVKIPVYNIVCNGKYETDNDADYNGDGKSDNYAGEGLFNLLNPSVKAKSEAFTDNTCNGHCEGNWTDKLYNKMVAWLQ